MHPHRALFFQQTTIRCLSYVWGVATHNSNITVNNMFKVSVTKNLRGFLERIRAGSSDPDGYIWIDAICINQQDELEKMAQVNIMGAIYAQATQVIAWLGWEWDRLGNASDNGTNEQAQSTYPDLHPPAPLDPTGFPIESVAVAETENPGIAGAEVTSSTVQTQDDDLTGENLPSTGDASDLSREDPTEAAIDFIRVFVPAFQVWIDQGDSPWSATFGSHAFGAPEMFEMLGIPRIGTNRWAALAHFLNRQWFQRTWIVQEAALAKTMLVVCGLQVLQWDQIVKTCIFLRASGWFFRLMEFLGPNVHAVGPGWTGLVLASLQDVCKLENVKPELGNMLTSPLRGLENPCTNQIESLEYDMLLFYLTTSRPFEAGDKRDKVYAPLSLLKQVRRPFFGEPQLHYEANYDDNKFVAEVYTDAAALIIRHAKTLRLLSQVEVRTVSSIERLPSWVPDFSERAYSGLLDVLLDAQGMTYDALPGTQCECIYDTTTNSIQLDGVPYDQISAFGPDFETLFQTKDWRPWIKYCSAVGTQNTAINEETYVESLWRTLIGNFDGNIYPAAQNMAACFKRYIQICTVIYLADNFALYQQPYTDWPEWSCFDELREMDTRHSDTIPSVQELQDFVEQWRSIYITELIRQSGTNPNDPPPLVTNPQVLFLKTMQGPAEIYGLAVSRFYPKRRFFTCNNGYVGLAPSSAVEGDQIWFLSGGKTPFVLRPNTQRGEDMFHLLGECYVHGLMSGEVKGMISDAAFRRITIC